MFVFRFKDNTVIKPVKLTIESYLIFYKKKLFGTERSRESIDTFEPWALDSDSAVPTNTVIGVIGVPKCRKTAFVNVLFEGTGIIGAVSI